MQEVFRFKIIWDDPASEQGFGFKLRKSLRSSHSVPRGTMRSGFGF